MRLLVIMLLNFVAKIPEENGQLFGDVSRVCQLLISREEAGRKSAQTLMTQIAEESLLQGPQKQEAILQQLLMGVGDQRAFAEQMWRQAQETVQQLMGLQKQDTKSFPSAEDNEAYLASLEESNMEITQKSNLPQNPFKKDNTSSDWDWSNVYGVEDDQKEMWSEALSNDPVDSSQRNKSSISNISISGTMSYRQSLATRENILSHELPLATKNSLSHDPSQVTKENSSLHNSSVVKQNISSVKSGYSNAVLNISETLASSPNTLPLLGSSIPPKTVTAGSAPSRNVTLNTRLLSRQILQDMRSQKKEIEKWPLCSDKSMTNKPEKYAKIDWNISASADFTSESHSETMESSNESDDNSAYKLHSLKLAQAKNQAYDSIDKNVPVAPYHAEPMFSHSNKASRGLLGNIPVKSGLLGDAFDTDFGALSGNTYFENESDGFGNGSYDYVAEDSVATVAGVSEAWPIEDVGTQQQWHYSEAANYEEENSFKEDDVTEAAGVESQLMQHGSSDISYEENVTDIVDEDYRRDSDYRPSSDYDYRMPLKPPLLPQPQGIKTPLLAPPTIESVEETSLTKEVYSNVSSLNSVPSDNLVVGSDQQAKRILLETPDIWPTWNEDEAMSLSTEPANDYGDIDNGYDDSTSNLPSYMTGILASVQTSKPCYPSPPMAMLHPRAMQHHMPFHPIALRGRMPPSPMIRGRHPLLQQRPPLLSAPAPPRRPLLPPPVDESHMFGIVPSPLPMVNEMSSLLHIPDESPALLETPVESHALLPLPDEMSSIPFTDEAISLLPFPEETYSEESMQQSCTRPPPLLGAAPAPLLGAAPAPLLGVAPAIQPLLPIGPTDITQYSQNFKSKKSVDKRLDRYGLRKAPSQTFKAGNKELSVESSDKLAYEKHKARLLSNKKLKGNCPDNNSQEFVSDNKEEIIGSSQLSSVIQHTEVSSGLNAHKLCQKDEAEKTSNTPLKSDSLPELSKLDWSKLAAEYISRADDNKHLTSANKVAIRRERSRSKSPANRERKIMRLSCDVKKEEPHESKSQVKTAGSLQSSKLLSNDTLMPSGVKRNVLEDTYVRENAAKKFFIEKLDTKSPIVSKLSSNNDDNVTSTVPVTAVSLASAENNTKFLARARKPLPGGKASMVSLKPNDDAVLTVGDVKQLHYVASNTLLPVASQSLPMSSASFNAHQKSTQGSTMAIISTGIKTSQLTHPVSLAPAAFQSKSVEISSSGSPNTALSNLVQMNLQVSVHSTTIAATDTTINTHLTNAQNLSTVQQQPEKGVNDKLIKFQNKQTSLSSDEDISNAVSKGQLILNDTCIKVSTSPQQVGQFVSGLRQVAASLKQLTSSPAQASSPRSLNECCQLIS